MKKQKKVNNIKKFYYYVPPTFNLIKPKLPQEYFNNVEKKYLATLVEYEYEKKPIFEIINEIASSHNVATNSIYCNIEDKGDDIYDNPFPVLSFYTANITKVKNLSYKKDLENYNKKLAAFEQAEKEHKELLREYNIWKKEEEKRRNDEEIKRALNLLKKHNISIMKEEI